MVRKITTVVFIASFLAMVCGCNEAQKPASQNSQKEITEAERQANTEKALESRFKKSEPKGW